MVICKRSRSVLVLHERKTRITLMSRLAGKSAAETIAAMMAAFRRLHGCAARFPSTTTPASPATCCCATCSRLPRILRRLRQLAEGRHRKRQRADPTLAAAPGGPRRDSRARHPGDRHDHQPPPAKMPWLKSRSRPSCQNLAATSKSDLLDALRFPPESTGFAEIRPVGRHEVEERRAPKAGHLPATVRRDRRRLRAKRGAARLRLLGAVFHDDRQESS